MKTKRINFTILTLLISISVVIGQTETTSEKNKIEIQKDIAKNLIGEWEGTLTYIDYNTNEPYSMPVELVIQSKRKDRKLILNYTYPNEPKANSKGKLVISKDRRFLNGKPIVSRSMTEDGIVQVVTEFEGKDGNDNKNALIKNFYTHGMDTFNIRKEVLFEGSKEWKMRNEYSFTKK